jgi:hypothetical protein
MLLLTSFKKIFSQVGRTIVRFPMPILMSLLAFVFIILEIKGFFRTTTISKNFIFVRIILEAISGISLYIVFDFFAESQQIEKSKKLGLYLLGFCILGLHYYSITPGMFDSETIFVSRYLIIIASFHLAVSFVTFYHSDETISFWRYNYFLFIQFLKSIGFSISLFAGLGSAIWAVDNLFGMGFNGDYYVYLGAFIFIVFNTIVFLMGIPENFNDFKIEKEYKKSIKLFVQYVLLPVAGIYMLILYAYMFKSLMEHQIPNGWICIPILLFSVLGLFAYLLIYPIRNDESNRLFFVYSKYFFYSLLPLLTLYFNAIFKRIIPYGITEDRYIVFILGIWLLIVSLYIIFSKKDNILLIPVSLFLILSLSAIGPWGMFQLSGQNQMMRLEKLLTRNHLLVNKKLVHNKQQKVNNEDAKSIRSILFYLKKRGELNRIHRWLGKEDQLVLEKAIKDNEIFSLNAIFNSNEMSLGDQLYDNFSLNATPYFFEVIPYALDNSYTMLHVNLFQQQETNDTNRHSFISNRTSIIYIEKEDTVFNINLNEKINSLLQYQKAIDSLKKVNNTIDNSIHLVQEGNYIYSFPTDSMKYTMGENQLLINQMQIQRYDSSNSIFSIDGYLLLKR